MPSMFEETRKLAALRPPPPIDVVALLERAEGLLRRDRPAAAPERSEVVDGAGGVWRRRGRDSMMRTVAVPHRR